MFSSQYSGEPLPCQEEVVVEVEAVAEVEVEVEEVVEDHLADQTQPFSQ
jgi:hypothetical protein